VTTSQTAEKVAAPAAETPPARTASWSDPTPIALGLFAFALGIYFIRFVSVDASTVAAGPATEALNYAALVGGLAEVIAGLFGIVRGNGYPAYVMSTFGIWLLGFFFLATQGAESKAFTADAFAWYVLVLVVPVAILAVPSFVHRQVAFSVAFVALIALLLTLGIAYHLVYDQVTAAASHNAVPDLATAIDLLKASAWAGLVAAVAVCYAFASEVYHITGVLAPKAKASLSR
jgi:uncharacterized protein